MIYFAINRVSKERCPLISKGQAVLRKLFFKQRKKVAFWNEYGYEWTEPQTSGRMLLKAGKRLRMCQRYNDKKACFQAVRTKLP